MTVGKVGLQFVYTIICNKNTMSISSFFADTCSRQFLEFLLCIECCSLTDVRNEIKNEKGTVIYLRDFFLVSRGPKKDRSATSMSILRTVFRPDGLSSVSPI